MSETAHVVGWSVARISNELAALRFTEVPRHDTDGRHSRYRLKHPHEVRRVTDDLADFVKTAGAVRHDE